METSIIRYYWNSYYAIWPFTNRKIINKENDICRCGTHGEGVKNVVKDVYIVISIKETLKEILIQGYEKAKDFNKPIERLKNGNYKMKSGIVYTCF